MYISPTGVALVKEFEGLAKKRPDGTIEAYQDSVGIWTIGYGTVYYPDSTKVKAGDTCTLPQAIGYLTYSLRVFSMQVSRLVKVSVTQNQMDALCSLAYNIGIGNFSGSTLLKKVNADPNDPSIRAEFLVWDKAKGIEQEGLKRRRSKEADLYFTHA